MPKAIGEFIFFQREEVRNFPRLFEKSKPFVDLEVEDVLRGLGGRLRTIFSLNGNVQDGADEQEDAGKSELRIHR